MPVVTESLVQLIAKQVDESNAGEVVPVPSGLIEEAISFGVVGVAGQPGGLPHSGDGAASQADDPGSDDEAEGVVNRLVETGSEGG